MDYVIGVDIGAQSTKALLGGAAHADLWMQIISDVTGDTVHPIQEEIEAAVEPGWIQLDERTRPRPEVHARCEKHFTLYRDLTPSFKHVMHGLQETAA